MFAGVTSLADDENQKKNHIYKYGSRYDET